MNLDIVVTTNSYTSSKTKKADMGLLYTKAKIFHFKEKIDSLPRDNKAIMSPVHIRIKPTNVCNHNCSYCAYRVDNLQLGKDMRKRDSIPREKMLEIIDDLHEMEVKAVSFSGGGEPFCYPHLLETVKRLTGYKIKFASLTNGALLSGELAEVFAFNATWIRISIDGWDDDSYSSYRGVQLGEFTRVMTNIERFKKLGGSCYMGISLIVDNKNDSHVYESIGKLKSAGVNSVKVSPCIISNKGAENNKYHRPLFDAVKEQVGRAKQDFHDGDFEIFDAYHTLDEQFTKGYTWCPYIQILTVIGADLNIYSCQDKAYNLDEGLIGSIKERRFKDLWFSDKAQFFKINPSRVCGHHCVANSKNNLIFEYFNADKNHIEFV